MAKASARLDEDLYAEGFRQRLHTVVERSTQSDVARKLGIPVPYVNRYLKHQTPPVTFACRMAEKLGVNPVWLLTGDGEPMLTDIKLSTVQMAGDLLELVQAMDEVSQMRLGALAGKSQLKVLRDLNDALLKHEKLAETLSSQCRPIYERITNDLELVLHKYQFDRAAPLIRAGEQISRLANSPIQDAAFQQLRGYYSYTQGKYKEAIEQIRSAAMSQLAAPEPLTSSTCMVMNGLVGALASSMRTREAQNICEAYLCLGRGTIETDAQYNILKTQSGLFDIDLGNLNAGLEKVYEAAPFLDSDAKLHFANMTIYRGLYFKGAVSFRELLALEMDENTEFYLLFSVALWERDKKHLKEALNRYDSSTKKLPFSEILASYARAVYAALKRGRNNRGADCHKPIDELSNEMKAIDLFKLLEPMIRAEVAFLVGQKTRAKKLLTKARQTLAGAAPAQLPPLMFRAMQSRVTLDVISPGKATQNELEFYYEAKQFFDIHVSRGYSCFTPLVGVCPSRKPHSRS